MQLKSGDNQIMTKLIEQNNGLIWSIVKRFQGRGYEIEDLYQIGAMGFIKAIQRFNCEYEVKLSTYAVPYILGEIRRFVRDDGLIKVSRSTKELSQKIKVLQKEYFDKNNKEIGILELAEILELPKEEIAAAMECNREITSLHQEAYEEFNGKETMLDRLILQKDEVSEVVEKISLKDAIENLDTRSKEIILLRYYKDKTQTQVAKILGMSQVQVSRLEKKVLEKMRMKLIS